MGVMLAVEVNALIERRCSAQGERQVRGGLVENILPYAVSVITALISGICAFIAAKKQSDMALEAVKEANRHDIEKLLRQHEVDIENLKEKHRLEVERMEIDHRHQMELDGAAAQKNATGEIIPSIFGSAMASPVMAAMLEEQLKRGIGGESS